MVAVVAPPALLAALLRLHEAAALFAASNARRFLRRRRGCALGWRRSGRGTGLATPPMRRGRRCRRPRLRAWRVGRGACRAARRQSPVARAAVKQFVAAFVRQKPHQTRQPTAGSNPGVRHAGGPPAVPARKADQSEIQGHRNHEPCEQATCVSFIRLQHLKVRECRVGKRHQNAVLQICRVVGEAGADGEAEQQRYASQARWPPGVRRQPIQPAGRRCALAIIRARRPAGSVGVGNASKAVCSWRASASSARAVAERRSSVVAASRSSAGQCAKSVPKRSRKFSKSRSVKRRSFTCV